MNNKRLPDIIYGTAWKKEATTDLVSQALQAGFRGIDTANQPKHYAEALVGEALSRYFKAGGKREALFIQTKFTQLDGHDARIPYDGSAEPSEQVRQSFAVSLLNLGVPAVDSYILHSPYNHPDIGAEDLEVWKAFEVIHDSKKAERIGVSNINALQLAHLCERVRLPPMVVQNRCYANRGWDKDVRRICSTRGIVYQGFSLLTANPFVLGHARVGALCSKYGKNAEQIIFRFSRQIGILPLTGTCDESHMKQDLDIDDFQLEPSELQMIATLASR